MSAVFQCFKGLLAGGKARRKDFDQRRQGEDFDDEDAEAMEVSPAASTIHLLFWRAECMRQCLLNSILWQ